MLKGSYDDRRFFRPLRYDAAAARRARARADRRVQRGAAGAEPRGRARSRAGTRRRWRSRASSRASPRVLVAVNPTRGLDVGSARFVHEQLLALRARGSAILLVSTELEEVLALGDRLLALVRGRLVPVPEGADREAIGAILLGEADGSVALSGEGHERRRSGARGGARLRATRRRRRSGARARSRGDRGARLPGRRSAPRARRGLARQLGGVDRDAAEDGAAPAHRPRRSRSPSAAACGTSAPRASFSRARSPRRRSRRASRPARRPSCSRRSWCSAALRRPRPWALSPAGSARRAASPR